MNDIAVVTLTGVLVEMSSRSETETGMPVASFWLQVHRRWTGRAGQSCESKEFMEIQAKGHPANSIVKYATPGAALIVVGTLRVRSIMNDAAQAVQELYIEAETIGYVSPRALLEARGVAW